MKITKNIYTQIEALTQMDVNVALVGDEFFTYLKFDPSTSGNTSSIDYNTIVGICVTEFFEMEKINISQTAQLFYQQFTKFVEPLNPVNIKFEKTIPYYLFSKAYGV